MAPLTYPLVAADTARLNQARGPRFFIPTFLVSMWAHIAGESVKATRVEKQTETDIVTANCR